MEFKPEKIVNHAEAAAERAIKTGACAVRLAGNLVTQQAAKIHYTTKGMVDLFGRPETATANAADQAEEVRRIPEIIEDLEQNIRSREAELALQHEICAQTAAILKIPVFQRTEDDNLDLKAAAYMFMAKPEISFGVGGLPEDDLDNLTKFFNLCHELHTEPDA